MIFEVSSLAGTAVLTVPGLGDALRWLGRGFALGLQAVSPAIDIDMGAGPPPRDMFVKILVCAAPLTFFFCYVVSGFLSYVSETMFAGQGFAGLSFIDDWWNFVIYLVVVPLYVSCAIFLIYVSALSWRRLNAIYAQQAGATSFWSNSTRAVGFFAISFTIAGLYISEYLTDLADPHVTKTLYWFFTPMPDGVGRTLNRAGYYYVFLNAILLFITSMAAFSFIALSIEIFRFGKYIPRLVAAQASPGPGEDGKEELLRSMEKKIQETLDEYAYAYIVAKMLVATYAVNIILWQASPAGKVGNVNSAIVALAIIGLIFLVVPRLYLNSKWHRAKLSVLKAMGKTGEIGDELAPRRFRRSETWLDVLFIFLLAKTAVNQFEHSGVIDFFFQFLA